MSTGQPDPKPRSQESLRLRRGREREEQAVRLILRKQKLSKSFEALEKAGFHLTNYEER
ncbi:MAG TPA: hypothetical protein VFS97_10600 [Nitrososphaeraceae archaeon]|nr:hypothetical protein [Nitrososphaeraceae archaeon]